MKKIYSKIDTSKLLHLIGSLSDLKENRMDVAPEEEFLQLAILKLEKGKTFKPHKHIYHDKITNIAQESWFVHKGRVKCIFYDLDDSIISEEIIEEGSFSMTFRGGHNYVILENNTLVLEYKTGPYLGVEMDKTFIN